MLPPWLAPMYLGQSVARGVRSAAQRRAEEEERERERALRAQELREERAFQTRQAWLGREHATSTEQFRAGLARDIEARRSEARRGEEESEDRRILEAAERASAGETLGHERAKELGAIGHVERLELERGQQRGRRELVTEKIVPPSPALLKALKRMLPPDTTPEELAGLSREDIKDILKIWDLEHPSPNAMMELIQWMQSKEEPATQAPGLAGSRWYK